MQKIWDKIVPVVAETIEIENKIQPFCDRAITELLAQRGIKTTVWCVRTARESLKIPISSKRRKQFIQEKK